MRGCETWTLSEAERIRCLEIALEICSGRVPVCAAVAAISIPDSITVAQRAEEMGADMIAVVIPPWIRREADIVSCVKAVQIPYPFLTSFTSVGGAGDLLLSTQQLAKLPAESPNIRYLKEEAPLGAVGTRFGDFKPAGW